MRSHWNPGPVLVAMALLIAGAPGWAEETPAGPAQTAPPVALDKLFDLPPSVQAPAPRYGGASRNEWESRFVEARTKLEEAESALAAAQEELGALAAETDQWQMSAPGLGGLQAANGETGPLNYRLHQEIRRQREEIARAEKQLQELRIKANLAGVPREWMEPPAEADTAEPAAADAVPTTPVSAEASE